MCKEKLRKVTFSMGEFGSLDLNHMPEEEREYMDRDHEGYFHKWVENSETSAQTGKPFNKTYGLIEDAETGAIKMVDYNYIVFKD